MLKIENSQFRSLLYRLRNPTQMSEKIGRFSLDGIFASALPLIIACCVLVQLCNEQNDESEYIAYMHELAFSV